MPYSWASTMIEASVSPSEKPLCLAAKSAEVTNMAWVKVATDVVSASSAMMIARASSPSRTRARLSNSASTSGDTTSFSSRSSCCAHRGRRMTVASGGGMAQHGGNELVLWLGHRGMEYRVANRAHPLVQRGEKFLAHL